LWTKRAKELQKLMIIKKEGDMAVKGMVGQAGSMKKEDSESQNAFGCS